MMMKYDRGASRITAVYTQGLGPLQRDNPLIEALPEIQSREQIAENLRHEISYQETDITLSAEKRSILVSALYHYFAPWELHVTLAQNIYSTICDGYINRNPMTNAYQESIRQVRTAVQEGDANFTSCYFAANNPVSSSFSVIGYSGMGKSSSVRNILSQIPQIIQHEEYQDHPLPETQITWMYVECPHDGSVKGLCQMFLMEFDRLIHSNTASKYGAGARVSTNQLITQIAMLARRYHLGVLVIDEIQDIRAARGKTQQEIIQFLIQLVNMIQIPIILIGTPPAVQVLQSNTMLGRRFPTKCYFDLPSEDQQEWKILCKSMFGTQWTKNRTRLTKEIAHELFAASYGLTSSAIMMCVEAQREAIRQGGDELITPDMIRTLANRPDFRAFRQRLDSIRSMEQAAQISGDCATLSWGRNIRALDVKDVLPMQAQAPKADELLQKDATSDSNEANSSKQKKRKPSMNRKKKEQLENGYEQLKSEGLIGDLDADLLNP